MSKNLIALVLCTILSMGFMGALNAQAPVVALGSVPGCAGDTVNVPINVSNFTNISAVSLEINYDSSALRYVDFNSSSLTGNLIVNNPSVGGVPTSRVLLSWFSLTPAVVGSGSGLLMNLRFVLQAAPPRALSFNVAVPGQCELADVNGDVIAGALFTNGGVTAPATFASISTQPPAALSLASGASGSIAVTATNVQAYQWQQFTSGQWTNLTNAGFFAGVTTNTLQFNSVTPALNGAIFRVGVSGGCPFPSYSSNCTLTVTQVGNIDVALGTVAACYRVNRRK
jgi:hypothetical protein